MSNLTGLTPDTLRAVGAYQKNMEKRKELLDEANKLAEESWQECDSCNKQDKYFWINGYINGYFAAKNK